jgi:hypothetical protein
LDYYRILGLPIQATPQQLQQAYHDRTRQTPRHEYSQVAVGTRQQLIDEAYKTLGDPQARQVYDASFLAKSYGVSVPLAVELPGDRPAAGTPNIDIDDRQLVGALMLLQELGEYEIVLNLGYPHLSNPSDIHLGRFGEPQLALADILLTVVLAYLELGREQWQQGQSEAAATSLKIGQELLLHHGLFASLRGEIQSDLYKLRPYRILELLAHPDPEGVPHRQGLQLLRGMLKEREGIDGRGDDRSGLSVEDFLRFIQQLRVHLSAREQLDLFESEARRPSAVATYLAAYALMATGFAHRHPEAIQRASLLLRRLGSRQDVYLEQAVCALLLGQTAAACETLERSQEQDTLALIQEQSQGSPDLLPGLCAYSEHWLQTEVLPHFRDLAAWDSSLKDYFADPRVQQALEALPEEAPSANEWSVVPGDAMTATPQEWMARDRTRRTPGAIAALSELSQATSEMLPQFRPPQSFSPAPAAWEDPATFHEVEDRGMPSPPPSGYPAAAYGVAYDRVPAPNPAHHPAPAAHDTAYNSAHDAAYDSAYNSAAHTAAPEAERGMAKDGVSPAARAPQTHRPSPPLPPIIPGVLGERPLPPGLRDSGRHDPGLHDLGSPAARSETGSHAPSAAATNGVAHRNGHHPPAERTNTLMTQDSGSAVPKTAPAPPVPPAPAMPEETARRDRARPAKRSNEPRMDRLALVLIAAILGLGLAGWVVWQVVARALGWVSSLSGPTLEPNQPTLRLDRPPVDIPDPAAAIAPDPAASGPLSTEAAAEAIRGWLTAKSAAMGENHTLDALNNALTEPMLSDWRGRAEEAQGDGVHWEYEHEVSVESVEPNTNDVSQGAAIAQVRETARFYQQGNLSRRASYDDQLRVRYELIRVEGQWRIRDVEILR